MLVFLIMKKICNQILQILNLYGDLCVSKHVVLKINLIFFFLDIIVRMQYRSLERLTFWVSETASKIYILMLSGFNSVIIIWGFACISKQVILEISLIFPFFIRTWSTDSKFIKLTHKLIKKNICHLRFEPWPTVPNLQVHFR